MPSAWQAGYYSVVIVKMRDRERGTEEGQGRLSSPSFLDFAHRPFLVRLCRMYFGLFSVTSSFLIYILLLCSFLVQSFYFYLFPPSFFGFLSLCPPTLIPCMARRVACVPHFPKCAAILAPHSSLSARLAACVACSCRLFGKGNANSHQAVLAKPVLGLFYYGLLFSQLESCKVRSKQLVSDSEGRYFLVATLLALSFHTNAGLEEGNKQQKTENTVRTGRQHYPALGQVNKEHRP